MPAWFFWTFFVIFMPMALLFHWIWRYRRRNWAQTLAEGAKATAIVTDYQRWKTPRRSGGGPLVHIQVTLEFRDQAGNPHRVVAKTVDHTMFMPKLGDRPTVVYNPNHPAGAKLLRFTEGSLATFLIFSIAIFLLALGSLGGALYITFWGG